MYNSRKLAAHLALERLPLDNLKENEKLLKDCEFFKGDYSALGCTSFLSCDLSAEGYSK